MSILKSFLLAGIAIFCIGCGTAKTIVLEPVCTIQPFESATVDIHRDDNTINVPEKVQAKFEQLLAKRLYKNDLISKGKDLTLKYRFVQYNEGSRLARYMTGGIGSTGESSLTIFVDYVDSQGNVIGKIQTEGRIDSGLFGGSFEEAMEKAADDIVDYTQNVLLNNLAK
jgi:hypothetical protein